MGAGLWANMWSIAPKTWSPLRRISGPRVLPSSNIFVMGFTPDVAPTSIIWLDGGPPVMQNIWRTKVRRGDGTGRTLSGEHLEEGCGCNEKRGQFKIIVRTLRDIYRDIARRGCALAICLIASTMMPHNVLSNRTSPPW